MMYNIVMYVMYICIISWSIRKINKVEVEVAVEKINNLKNDFKKSWRIFKNLSR